MNDRIPGVVLRVLPAINGEHLAALDDRNDPPVAVQSFTCHRGARAPQTLQAGTAGRARECACLTGRAGLAILALTGLGAIAAGPVTAQEPEPSGIGSAWVVELEAGPAWQSYNDVEIPNDGSATRFSLRDLAGSGPWPSARVYVTWNISARHGLRLLLAPFSLTETGVPEQPIDFAGASYIAGEATTATYTFNSYRLSYRYRVHAGETTTAWIGFTAKLRDAVIALEQGATSSEKTDLGFVPLLHVAGDWRFAPRWRLRLDVDALAGGPGRAEDAALELGYELGDRWTVEAGYRMVEGGADVTEVYTFAWLHYAVLSLVWRP